MDLVVLTNSDQYCTKRWITAAQPAYERTAPLLKVTYSTNAVLRMVGLFVGTIGDPAMDTVMTDSLTRLS
jgi:hypothetical protein